MNRVKEIRELEGMSIADLVRKAVLDRKTILKIERGEDNVRSTSKHRVAKVFRELDERKYTYEFLFPEEVHST